MIGCGAASASARRFGGAKGGHPCSLARGDLLIPPNHITVTAAPTRRLEANVRWPDLNSLLRFNRVSFWSMLHLLIVECMRHVSKVCGGWLQQ